MYRRKTKCVKYSPRVFSTKIRYKYDNTRILVSIEIAFELRVHIFMSIYVIIVDVISLKLISC